jgi:hypothetical protein
MTDWCVLLCPCQASINLQLAALSRILDAVIQPSTPHLATASDHSNQRSSAGHSALKGPDVEIETGSAGHDSCSGSGPSAVSKDARKDGLRRWPVGHTTSQSRAGQHGAGLHQEEVQQDPSLAGLSSSKVVLESGQDESLLGETALAKLSESKPVQPGSQEALSAHEVSLATMLDVGESSSAVTPFVTSHDGWQRTNPSPFGGRAADRSLVVRSRQGNNLGTGGGVGGSLSGRAHPQTTLLLTAESGQVFFTVDMTMATDAPPLAQPAPAGTAAGNRPALRGHPRPALAAAAALPRMQVLDRPSGLEFTPDVHEEVVGWQAAGRSLRTAELLSTDPLAVPLVSSGSRQRLAAINWSIQRRLRSARASLTS